MQEALEILFEDESLIAVNKPPGHLVHPADQPKPDDLVTMKILRDQINCQVFPVHRIDRPTSGILLFSKNTDCARTLMHSFEKKQVQKIYWAIIDGIPAQKEWECAKALQKNEGDVFKTAHTCFHLLEKIPSCGLSLIKAKPLTGRFHQIRRHLAYAEMPMPIVGDYRYAGIERSDYLGETLGTGTRMLLQAKELYFPHPIKGETISISAPVDRSIEKVLSR